MTLSTSHYDRPDYSVWLSAVPWHEGMNDNEFLYIGSQAGISSSMSYSVTPLGIPGAGTDQAVVTDSASGAVLTFSISCTRVNPDNPDNPDVLMGSGSHFMEPKGLEYSEKAVEGKAYFDDANHCVYMLDGTTLDNHNLIIDITLQTDGDYTPTIINDELIKTGTVNLNNITNALAWRLLKGLRERMQFNSNAYVLRIYGITDRIGSKAQNHLAYVDFPVFINSVSREFVIEVQNGAIIQLECHVRNMEMGYSNV